MLAIALPTYRRINEFKRLLNQLSANVKSLPQDVQSLISFRVYENPSTQTELKLAIFRQTSFGSCPAEWNINSINIGGDANIEQAYSRQKDAAYTWVIGDDEQILSDALSKIITTLKARPDLGLLLLRDTSYPVSRVILERELWASYEEFAKFLASRQPHLLIAHTLISANIVRSDLFDVQQSRRERCLVSPRSEIPFSFAHMKAILYGLSGSSSMIMILKCPVLDTTGRATCADNFVNQATLMRCLYIRHLSWVTQEFGIPLWPIVLHNSMSVCMPSLKLLSCAAIVSLMRNIEKSFRSMFRPYGIVHRLLIR